MTSRVASDTPKVVILHDRVEVDAPVEERDLLHQVEAIDAALGAVGCEVTRLPLTLDLEAARTALRDLSPDLVFNLTEGLGGNGRLALLGPLLLDDLGLPYTGCGLAGMAISSSKLLAKQALSASGLPTPPWITEVDRYDWGWPGPWIVKPVWEHASVGMDDTAIVGADRVGEALALRAAEGGEWFAEAYIEGREINLALLACPSRGGGSGALESLPPAEIRFDRFPPGKPRIVNYAAKWEETSFEYQNADRSFEFADADAELLGALAELAQQCARACSLAGYARIDVRVDRAGRPWIIDVNANPCLSPDSGFVANAARAGLSYSDVVARIAEESGVAMMSGATMVERGEHVD